MLNSWVWFSHSKFVFFTWTSSWWKGCCVDL